MRRRQSAIGALGLPRVAGTTFNELFDFLVDHQGARVYIEVGLPDPESHIPAEARPIGMHDIEIGRIEDAVDPDLDRGVVRVPLLIGTESRLYIDEGRISRIQVDRDAAKVWFHDAFYIAIVT